METASNAFYGVWNAQVMEAACKLSCTETAGNGNNARMESACKETVGDGGKGLMSDAVRLEEHKRIKRRTSVKHRRYKTHLKRCTDTLCHGGYPGSLDFLFAVCHCTDNDNLTHGT